MSDGYKCSEQLQYVFRSNPWITRPDIFLNIGTMTACIRNNKDNRV